MPQVPGIYDQIRDQLAGCGFGDITVEPVQQKPQVKFAPGLDMEIPMMSPMHLVALGGDQPLHSEMKAVVVTARACQ